MYQAGRLIYLSLAYSHGKKAIVARHQGQMEELLQKFQAEEAFRRVVEEGLKAMELKLLALEDNGLHLSAIRAESLFSMTVTDYSRLLARSELKAADILCIHCAIATTFFPTESDLEAPVEDLGVVTLPDVMDILRRFARAEEKDDQSREHLYPQVRTVAKRLREMPEDNPDIRRLGGGHSWRELVDQVMRHMVETGYLLSFEEGPGELEYRPTPAYQMAIREGMVYTFHAFRDFLVQAEKDASHVSSL
jgi:hypothetical protein